MIANLSQLKRYFQGGGTIILCQRLFKHPGGEVIEKTGRYIGIARKPEKVQTNAVRFEGGSWLYFGKATDYTFSDIGFSVESDGIKLDYKYA